jgi:hypothetical protein
LCCEAEGEARVHYEHAGFDCVDYVEHGLVVLVDAGERKRSQYLFGNYDNLGAVDSCLDLGGCEGWEERWLVEIASSIGRDDIQTDDEDCIEALCLVNIRLFRL